MLNLYLNLLALSSSAPIQQAPQTSADLWFFVTQGLLGLLLLIGVKAVTGLVRQVERLTKRMDQFEKDSIDRHHDNQVELLKLKNRLASLEEKHE